LLLYDTTTGFQVWLQGVNFMLVSDVKLGWRGSPQTASSHGPVRTVAVAGGQGGVGKTSIAVNLALGLARDGGRVMLLDADLGMANVDDLLGLYARSSLLNVLRGELQIDDIIINGPGDLMIVPAACGIRQLTELGTAECAGIVRIFSELKDPIDTLVIDTSTGISECVACFCAASSEVLVVIDNEPASLRCAIGLINRLQTGYGVARFHVVANRVQSAREGDEIFARLLNLLADQHDVLVSYAGYVPADDSLRRAVLQHQAVIDAFPRSRSAMALRNLARRVGGWPRQNSPRGHLEFFIERLLHQNNVEMEVTS
jgi:flagellar biosynthesis protein FlhG